MEGAMETQLLIHYTLSLLQGKLFELSHRRDTDLLFFIVVWYTDCCLLNPIQWCKHILIIKHTLC